MYDDLIMDHIKNARNFRVLEDGSSATSGSNPLCGDTLTLYLKMKSGVIFDISFQCTCCGISMASSSMMTVLVKGFTVAGAAELAGRMKAALYDKHAFSSAQDGVELKAILSTARVFPARIRCAVLPWVVLEGALDGKPEVVFTH